MSKMKSLFTVILVAAFFSAYAQYPKLTVEEWQEDLSYLKKLVNEKYDHLFYRISQEEFNDRVDELHNSIPKLEPHEIIVGMARLVALFKAGHSGIPLAVNYHGKKLATGFHLLPINFYQFSDGVFVQGIHRDYKEAIGAKVLKIGNKKIEAALHAIQPVVSAENEQFFKAYGMSILSCPEVLHAQGVVDDLKTIPIVFSKEGRTFTLEFNLQEEVHIPTWYGLVQNNEHWIESRDEGQTPVWLKNLNRFYHFEYIEESKTVYVRHSQMEHDEQESIPQFYQRVFDFVENHDVDKFILDLRLNFGGDNYKNKPIILGLIKSKINKKGKLFTIIGRNTFSAAQNLVNELEYYTETTFIGEPTSQNVNFFGDANTEHLPNSKLSVLLSYMWWQDKDPRDKRLATSPEVFVELSSEDYKENRDPVLHAALNYYSSVYSTLEMMKSKLDHGAFEDALQIGMEYVKKPENKTRSLASKINALGYEYMGNKKAKLALEVFTLNTKLYPEVINNWDSLAEGYLNLRDMKKAIFYYEKVIKMDPEGRTATHARDMLNKIKNAHN